MVGRRLVPLIILSVSSGLAAPPVVRWQTLDWGLEFARWEISSYDSATGTGLNRMGEPYVAALRVDPSRYRFEVFHFSQSDTAPLTVEEWRDKLGATAVVNAGQYYPDLSYMGLLVSGKHRFGSKLHKQWQGLFLAEPTDRRARKARILDLKYSRFSPDATPYTQIAQSFMLFDANRKKRVVKGEWAANRTAVAEDNKGRIVIFVTEGGLTLWDFAQFLQSSGLGLVRAMSMDGGYESELAVKTDKLSYVTYGQWETDDYGDISLPGIHIGLPAVIGIFPR